MSSNFLIIQTLVNISSRPAAFFCVRSTSASYIKMVDDDMAYKNKLSLIPYLMDI